MREKKRSRRVVCTGKGKKGGAGGREEGGKGRSARKRAYLFTFVHCSIRTCITEQVRGTEEGNEGD